MDTGELLGFLFFLAIAAIGWLHKISEERKAEERRKGRKTTRPEDLPEATRRMLYGDTGEPRSFEPPVAKPRQAGPPLAAPRTAVPRTATPRTTPPPPATRPAPPMPPPPLRPTMARPPAAQEPEPVSLEELAGEEISPAGWEHELPWEDSAPVRPVPAPRRAPTALEQQQAHLQQALRQAQLQAARRRQQAEAAAQAAGAPVPPQPALKPAPRPKATPAQAPPSPMKIELLQLFQDPRQIRRGIIFQEILAPPRGLRPYSGA
ncbi:MAG: hypothetical protein HYZ00_13955 [Candidatus Hydrogenedentes bacterium]|nr:hypothetical protein [Deltaproteobacteria bacterium]MBI3119793.1 hypothetical protein [Candidatus Hydrogenedentota bacterium]